MTADAWDGLPANPERDGWHWVQDAGETGPRVFPCFWEAHHAAWCDSGMYSPLAVVDLGFRYLGPCLTPAERDAKDAEIARLELARAEAVVAVNKVHRDRVASEVLTKRMEAERDALRRECEAMRALLETGVALTVPNGDARSITLISVDGAKRFARLCGAWAHEARAALAVEAARDDAPEVL